MASRTAWTLGLRGLGVGRTTVVCLPCMMTVGYSWALPRSCLSIHRKPAAVFAFDGRQQPGLEDLAVRDSRRGCRTPGGHRREGLGPGSASYRRSPPSAFRGLRAAVLTARARRADVGECCRQPEPLPTARRSRVRIIRQEREGAPQGPRSGQQARAGTTGVAPAILQAAPGAHLPQRIKPEVMAGH